MMQLASVLPLPGRLSLIHDCFSIAEYQFRATNNRDNAAERELCNTVTIGIHSIRAKARPEKANWRHFTQY